MIVGKRDLCCHGGRGETMNPKFEDIPKNLPYWKYAPYESYFGIPYWQYKLGEDANLGRFIVFKGKDRLERSWFITDYIVPCTKDKKFFTEAEVADPAVKPLLAIVVIRKEQGSKVIVDLLFDHNYTHPADPILLAAGEIRLNTDMVSMYPSDYRAVEAFEKLIKEKYGKYLEATERQLMGQA
jgi:hypothetical protein